MDSCPSCGSRLPVRNSRFCSRCGFHNSGGARAAPIGGPSGGPSSLREPPPFGAFFEVVDSLSTPAETVSKQSVTSLESKTPSAPPMAVSSHAVHQTPPSSSSGLGLECLHLLKWISDCPLRDGSDSLLFEEMGPHVESLRRFASRIQGTFVSERINQIRNWFDALVEDLFTNWDDRGIQQDSETLCVYTRLPTRLFQHFASLAQQLIRIGLPETLENVLIQMQPLLVEFGEFLLHQLVGNRALLSQFPSRYVPVINDFGKMGLLLKHFHREIERTDVFGGLDHRPEIGWMKEKLHFTLRSLGMKACEELRETCCSLAKRTVAKLFADGSEHAPNRMTSFTTEMVGIAACVDCLEEDFKQHGNVDIVDVVLETYLRMLMDWPRDELDADDFERLEEDGMGMNRLLEEIGCDRRTLRLLPNVYRLIESEDETSATTAIGFLMRWADFSCEHALALVNLAAIGLEFKIPLIRQLLQDTRRGPKTLFSRIVVNKAGDGE